MAFAFFETHGDITRLWKKGRSHNAHGDGCHCRHGVYNDTFYIYYMHLDGKGGEAQGRVIWPHIRLFRHSAIYTCFPVSRSCVSAEGHGLARGSAEELSNNSLFILYRYTTSLPVRLALPHLIFVYLCATRYVGGEGESI